MRASHSTSPNAKLRSGCSGLIERSSISPDSASRQHLGHDLARACLDHHPVALAHVRAGLDDQHVAIAVERQHGIALNLQAKELSVCAPAVRSDPSPDRPESRHRRRSRRHRPGQSLSAERRMCAPARSGLVHRRLAFDEAQKLVERGIGRLDDLGQRLGGRPARPAVGGSALGLVEGGGVEPRALGQPGGGKRIVVRPARRWRPRPGRARASSWSCVGKQEKIPCRLI